MKNGNGQDEEFGTSDLYFAAYLQTVGLSMVRINREDKKRIFFVFDTRAFAIEDLRTSWINGTAKVAAQQYAANIKSLKSVVHME